MTDSIQVQHSQLLEQLDLIIAQAKIEDPARIEFFKTIKQFISLDQDNPLVHAFLYEVERKLIEFAQLRFDSRINIDLFEDEEGKNLFHHIGININMLFEELADTVVPIDQLQALLDMFDGYGVMANSEGKLIRMNKALSAILGEDSLFGTGSDVSKLIPQFGTYLYKAALITGEIDNEPAKYVLEGKSLDGLLKMKHVAGGGEKNAVFVILITPNN